MTFDAAKTAKCTKPHNAALMTEALAELLVTNLDLNGHHAPIWISSFRLRQHKG
jgi:hypothetical protein